MTVFSSVDKSVLEYLETLRERTSLTGVGNTRLQQEITTQEAIINPATLLGQDPAKLIEEAKEEQKQRDAALALRIEEQQKLIEEAKFRTESEKLLKKYSGLVGHDVGSYGSFLRESNQNGILDFLEKNRNNPNISPETKKQIEKIDDTCQAGAANACSIMRKGESIEDPEVRKQAKAYLLTRITMGREGYLQSKDIHEQENARQNLPAETKNHLMALTGLTHEKVFKMSENELDAHINKWLETQNPQKMTDAFKKACESGDIKKKEQVEMWITAYNEANVMMGHPEKQIDIGKVSAGQDVYLVDYQKQQLASSFKYWYDNGGDSFKTKLGESLVAFGDNNTIKDENLIALYKSLKPPEAPATNATAAVEPKDLPSNRSVSPQNIGLT